MFGIDADRQNLRQLLRQKVSKSTRQKVWQVSWQKFKFNCCVENVAMISFLFLLKSANMNFTT
jgi:hypothetical protein